MDPHLQSQNTGSLFTAGAMNISHSTFNDVKGNQYTTYNTYYVSTDLPHPQPWDRTLCSPAPKAMAHHFPGAKASGLSSYVMETTEICTLGLFPMVESTLELMTHLVDAAPMGSQTLFHRISPDLQDLVRLVAISSVAYQACTTQTPIGRLIRGSIDSRLALCNSRLVALHREMLDLPHRSVPLVRSVCRALYLWWTANEPEGITSIRSKLNAEATAFGEWLLDLKSFYWASPLLLVAKAEFCWEDLDELFISGPTLLKEIHVDKIIIIEPLQGDQLSVPIRFVTSFEDIHHVVQFACHGTAGAKYIDGRRYQLDDAATNIAVNPGRFAEDCLKDGKIFEVAMKLIRRDSVSREHCPRCGARHSEEEGNVSGWIRCRFCKTQFNSHISEASGSDTNAPDREATSLDGVGQDIFPQRQGDSQGWSYTMFRRLLIEIQVPSRQGQIGVGMGGDGGGSTPNERDADAYMDYFEPELPFDPDIIRSFNDLNDPASWKDIQMPGSFNSKESGMYTRSCAPSPPPVEAIAPYARDEPIMSMFDGSLNDGDPDSFMEYFQPELPFDPDIIRSFNDLSDPSSWQDLSMPAGFNLMTEVRSNAGTAGR